MLGLKQSYKQGLGRLTINVKGEQTQSVMTSRKEANYNLMSSGIDLSNISSLQWNGQKVELFTVQNWRK